MVKYRCVKADRPRDGAVYYNGRTYVEEGIQNARKRAMKMIHGDRNVRVLIWLESDYQRNVWVGFTEAVMTDITKKPTTYIAINGKGEYILNPNGSTKNKVW